MNTFVFPPPEPKRPQTRVHPVFLSFHGCAVRCVFCAQAMQTGQGERPLDDILADLDAELLHAKTPRELAFYGGTFTALPRKSQSACLALAAKHKAAGRVTRARASTRPDAFDAQRLAGLRAEGLDMLELGVQSFSDAALAASSRGYDARRAETACGIVKESGLALGVQLMPGMPGMTEEAFAADVRKALAFSPEAMRLYPCLVLADTPLEGMWRRGEYAPWTLETALAQLAFAQLAAWDASVRIIRIGLAPQDGLDQGGVLAGPRHPALGSMTRGEALFRYIARETANCPLPLEGLALPKRFQGEFWGHEGRLAHAYAALGLTRGNVFWSDGDLCEARFRARQ